MNWFPKMPDEIRTYLSGDFLGQDFTHKDKVYRGSSLELDDNVH